MSDEQLPPDGADVNEVNSRLQDGIQTCRSVLANYRTLLSGSDHEASSNDNGPDQHRNLSGIDER